MTKGTITGPCNLDDKKDWIQDCPSSAYPARFKVWLQNAYPKTHVNVHNFAIGGCQTKGLLNIIGDKLTQLSDVYAVFTHFTTNDNYEAVQDPVGLSIFYEDLIRFLLSSWDKKAAVIGISMLPGNKDTCVNKTVLGAHDVVNKYYQIPVLNIDQNKVEDADKRTWPADMSECNSAVLWETKSHPSWWQHQEVSDYLAYAWKFQQDYACNISKGITIPNLDNRIKFLTNSETHGNLLPHIPQFESRRNESDKSCITPISYYRPELFYEIEKNQYSQSGTNSTTDSWVLGEDIRGKKKPGWWIDNMQGAKIKFYMKIVNNNPIVIITYLSSYHKMGKAIVYFDDDRANNITIDALKPQHKVSLVESKQMCLHHEQNVINEKNTHSLMPLCSSINAAGTRVSWGRGDSRDHIVTIELLPATNPSAKHNKFKILSVVSC